MKKYLVAVGGVLLGFSFLAQAANQGTSNNSQPPEFNGSRPPSECSKVPDNLVSNCGFELGCFHDWLPAGDLSASGVEGGEVAHSGDFGAFFGPPRDFTNLGQVLSTTAGQSYTLSYWVQNTPTPNRFQLWWDDELIVDMENYPDVPYKRVVMEGLVASSDSTSLWFGFFNPTGYFYLDDVVVAPSR